MLKFLLLSLLVVKAESCASQKASFHKISGADCVRPDFTRLVWGSCDPLSCSLVCAKTPKCRAFSLPEGAACLCKLFVFDECSHRVQSEASCTHRVTVYVRSVGGVAPGRLCPEGFDFARFGTAYKVSSSPATSWADAKRLCRQEAGLSKFADAFDPDESRHLVWIKNVSHSPAESLFLGGYQLAGSASMADGWIWDACNESIRSDVWEPDRPNGDTTDCANVYKTHKSGIDDISCSVEIKYICECLSVF